MAEVVLAAETGRPTGSRAVRRLRREGKIPAVIYGHGTDPLPVADDRIFDKLEVLSVAKIIADAIDAVFEDTSVSELFGGDNLV